MKTFQVCGRSKSGKTATVTEIIRQLAKQQQRVASIKSIHYEQFRMDSEGTDTFKHAAAGADPVIAAGLHETDILYQQSMDFMDIARKISADWLVVEGFNEFALPKIACAKTKDELEHMVDRRTFAISGVISREIKEYKKIPVFNIQKPEHIEKLISLIYEKTFPLLPYVDDACCRLCGLTCSKLVEAIVQGEKKYEDCLIQKSDMKLRIGEKDIPMVPFVQNILRNTVIGIASELTGWEKNTKIELTINR
ncbi:molybdopterin-guanine dinucleotide biosynthesis protein B [candidate division KSB1 bacterium]|nr:molybdopterin-guanine dinucleotide biosynthesis protein B [candidate division KSB1 bacterium]